jgi:type IV pilus assembly protein PilA
MGRLTNMNFIKPLRRAEKGFTLIELLIVVAIIGILAAVIIPNLSSFLSTGKLGAARTEAENVKSAAAAFYADFGAWPANSANLTGTNPESKDYVTGTLTGSYTWYASGDPDYGLIQVSNTTYDNFVWSLQNQTWEGSKYTGP